MPQYWVVGGEYTDTNFTSLADGKKEVRKGPFSGYEEAKKVWQGMAWETVDDCLSHYHIEEMEPGSNPLYWVVGGQYEDAEFTKIIGEEERLGPYTDYEEAKKVWSQKAWQTVDDATAWYRVESLLPEENAASDNSGKLGYRFLTGPDDDAFCRRVSEAISEGYELYGSPSLTFNGERVICGQAVILKASD